MSGSPTGPPLALDFPDITCLKGTVAHASIKSTRDDSEGA